MDNKNAPFLIQPGDGKSYTLNEYLAQIEPQYGEYRDTMRRCISGLTDYAALLAAEGQEEQLPQLRRLCVEMAEFWGLTDDDIIDRAVFETGKPGRVPDLTERVKRDILAGLELYAREMQQNDPGLAQWIFECDVLVETLGEQWQMDSGLCEAPGMEGI